MEQKVSKILIILFGIFSIFFNKSAYFIISVVVPPDIQIVDTKKEMIYYFY